MVYSRHLLPHLPESLHSLFEFNPDPCYILDCQGAFIAFNDAVMKVTGYSAEEIMGHSYRALIVQEYLAFTESIFDRVLTKGLKVDFDTIIRCKNGESAELTITAMPVVVEGEILGIIGIAKDMSKRKQLERTLLAMQMQLQNIFDSTDLCLWSRDAKDGKLIHISPACKLIYGFTQEQFAANSSLWKQVVLEEDLPHVEQVQLELHAGKKIKQEYRIRRADGSIRWVYDYTVPVVCEEGQIIRYDGVISDITERKKTEEQLHYLAFRDALTGLPNRRLVRDRLIAAIEEAKVKQQLVAVMHLDLDGFKVINDSLGHELGDQLLRAVGMRIESCLQERDTISRSGGDEFTLILTGIKDMPEVSAKAEQILQELSRAFHIQGNELVVTTSIGITCYPQHGEAFVDLFRRADQAMYLAKAKGKNAYQLFTDELSGTYRKRLQLEQGLRKALENKEFEVHYQPIVDADGGRVIGLEALLRWYKEGRLISPAEFIPIAEEIGEILPIGEWVLREACLQLKRWQEQYSQELFISVNVSARQLEQTSLVDIVEHILKEVSLSPSSLHLEITESTAMGNMNHSMEMLHKLTKLGVSISIDDFGTGYSSIGYLEKFPITTIKLDRSFIKEGKTAIIKAVIAMATSLDVHVIAEGVETEEQKAQLLSIGCRYMQGYLYSKPLMAESASNLLSIQGEIRDE
jgi:diguanylate cyclase (GGDEF)-like protein/PAS domain S-box-containing protein